MCVYVCVCVIFSSGVLFCSLRKKRQADPTLHSTPRHEVTMECEDVTLRKFNLSTKLE
jgi:hypothetical protein